MSDKVTQRDIAESVSGLRQLAIELQQAATSDPVPGAPVGTVLVNARALLKGSDYLTSVADEMLKLIPQKKVVVPE